MVQRKLKMCFLSNLATWSAIEPMQWGRFHGAFRDVSTGKSEEFKRSEFAVFLCCSNISKSIFLFPTDRKSVV